MRWMGWVVLIGGIIGCSPGTMAADRPAERFLTASDLYAGLEATRVLPKDGALVLDVRNWPNAGGAGVITTDVLDLGGDGVLSDPAEVVDLQVAVIAKANAPASVTAQVRTGTTFFQAPGTWTEWQSALNVINPKVTFRFFSVTMAASAT